MGQWCRVNHHFLPFHFAVLSLYARAIILGNKSMTLLVFLFFSQKVLLAYHWFILPYFRWAWLHAWCLEKILLFADVIDIYCLTKKLRDERSYGRVQKKLLFVRLNILYLIIFSCWTWMRIKIRFGSEEVELPEMRALLSPRVSPPTGKQKHIF